MKINNTTISFFDYWDSFDSDYVHNGASGNQIKGWPISIGCYGNKVDVRNYLPEPYWGWTPSNGILLKAVFLNLNPGRGGDSQILNSNSDSDYITQAKKVGYKSMVRRFSEATDYPTTKWFQKKRADWLGGILPDKFQNTKVNEILCADLIPWHTPCYNAQAAKYAESVKKQICCNVICPIAEIATTAQLQDIVIAKGAHIEHLFRGILGPPTTYYNVIKKRRLSVFHLEKTRFIVFVGGQGMSLPSSGMKFSESGSAGGKEYSIKEIIETPKGYNMENQKKLNTKQIELINILVNIFYAKNFKSLEWPKIFDSNEVIYDRQRKLIQPNPDDKPDDKGKYDIDELLGEYFPATQVIKLYTKVIEKVAIELNVDEKDLENVVLLHEFGHWITHKLPYGNQTEWKNFCNCDVDDVLEGWAQLLTWWVVKDIPNLKKVFLDLNKFQSNPYHIWKQFQDSSVKELVLLRDEDCASATVKRWLMWAGCVKDYPNSSIEEIKKDRRGVILADDLFRK